MQNILYLPHKLIGNVQATPRLSEDKVKQCVDARLNGEYPPKAVAKVTILDWLCLFNLYSCSAPLSRYVIMFSFKDLFICFFCSNLTMR